MSWQFLVDDGEVRRRILPTAGRHVTRQLLWQEYRQACQNGYRYSRFCDLYREWLKKQDVVLRQQHGAGKDRREQGLPPWA